MNSFTACFHFWLLIASFEINFSIISVSSGHFFLKNFNSEKKIVLQKKKGFSCIMMTGQYLTFITR